MSAASLTPASNPASQQEYKLQSGQRIRWERDGQGDGSLTVRDAVTGEIIAVVQNLFELAPCGRGRNDSPSTSA